MKKQLLFLFVLLAGGILAQQPEFSFKLYFEDAVGNKDTLTLGYDANATDSIDTAFGEVNLINQAWSSSSFEVFVTDRGNGPKIKTKKQIVKKPCIENWQNWIYRTLFISIKNAHFPIVLNLNASILQNTCINGSFLALDDEPWERYSDLDSTVILNEPNYLNHYQDTIDGKTISYYWVILADSSQKSNILSTDDFEFDEEIKIYPNPVSGNSFTIQPEVNSRIDQVILYDNQGKKIKIEYTISETADNCIVSTNNLSKGFYTIEIVSDSKYYRQKIIIR